MKSIELTISDETLRDGEQQVGVFFSDRTKKMLARSIAKTGVHQIDLMPAVHESEAALARELCQQDLLAGRIAAATMMGPEFIDRSYEIGVRQIVLFHAVSDRLLFLRDKQIQSSREYQNKTIDDNIPFSKIEAARQAMLQKVTENLQYACQRGLKVYFAAEDASRADFNFLVRCISAFRPYLQHFLLCDTIGCLTPEKSYIWIRDLLALTDGAPLAVHYHNDMGLALENTLQAIRVGATGVSGEPAPFSLPY